MHITMARIVSILFLGIFILSYTAYSVRHSLPFLQYNFNKDYVAQNLCVNKDKPESGCQGKCYLKDQLEKSVKQDNDSESNFGGLQFEIFLEKSKNIYIPDLFLHNLSKVIWEDLIHLPSFFLKIPSPPPNF